MQNASISIHAFSNNRVVDKLTAKDDGFSTKLDDAKIGSDDDRVLCLDCEGIEPERQQRSFLFVPTFSCDSNCEINSERRGGG